MDNANTKEYLEKIRAQVVENLKRTSFAPSVQMTDVPRDPLVGGMDDEADAILDDEDEDENKDKRFTQRRFDQFVEKPGELSDSEDEEENAANGVRRQPNALKPRNHINYRNLDVADSGLESGLATPREASSIADEEMDTTGDAKMTEAPEIVTEGHRSPSAAEPPSRAEEASAAERTEMAIDKQEGEEEAASGVADATAPSAPVSHHSSPKAQDEDVAMEDIQAPAPAPEPEQPEEAVTSETQEEEKKPAEESPAPAQPAAEPPSPPKAPSPSPPKEAPEPEPSEKPETAEPTEQPAEAPQPAEATQPVQPTTEPAETKEKTPEAPKEDTAPEKAGPEGPKEADETKETNESNNTGKTKEPPSEQKPEEPVKSEE